MSVSREAPAGAAPGGSVQTDDSDVTGAAAAGPAQTPGRLQVPEWSWDASPPPLSESHPLSAPSLQTEAQHGPDPGRGPALQAGLGAGERGVGQGMFLC